MNIESLKNLADERFNHALYRKNIKERIEPQLVVTHNNGLFKATQHLIAFLNAWDDGEIFLEDEYNNPIKCDRLKLLSELKEAYQFAMNQWHNDFESSKKIRKL
jgi:hypothetical protein